MVGEVGPRGVLKTRIGSDPLFHLGLGRCRPWAGSPNLGCHVWSCSELTGAPSSSLSPVLSVIRPARSLFQQLSLWSVAQQKFWTPPEVFTTSCGQHTRNSDGHLAVASFQLHPGAGEGAMKADAKPHLRWAAHPFWAFRPGPPPSTWCCSLGNGPGHSYDL